MHAASDNRFYELAKRGLDVGVAITALALLGIPMLALAVAIKLESPGPVFYRGERVGRYGKGFRIFKLRSMRVHGGGPETTSADGQRVTAIGRFIRKLKFDELPQLINVLKGEMSLVGPRPEVRWCVEMYTDEEREILTVRPGITDWSSIKFNNEGEIVAKSAYADANQAYLVLIRPDKSRLHLPYLPHLSFTANAKILWQTIAVLGKTRSTMLGNVS